MLAHFIAVVLAATVLSLISLFVHTATLDDMRRLFHWNFSIYLERYDARDCSNGLIGEMAYMKQNQCYSWHDYAPFKGFRYYVSLAPCRHQY
jgi:hypothetical protein